MKLRLRELMSSAKGNTAYEVAKVGFELRSLTPELLIFFLHHWQKILLFYVSCLSCRPGVWVSWGVAGRCSEVLVV